MAIVIVGKVPCLAAVTDNEYLDEAKQRSGIAVSGITLVLHNLFHGSAGADSQIFQLYLHHRNAVEQQNDIIAVMTGGGIDAKLIDDFKAVFAPVARIHQRKGKRRSVIPLKRMKFAKRTGRLVHVTADDHIHEAGKLGVGEMNAVQFLEAGAEIGLQRRAIMNVRAIDVLKIVRQFIEELLFYILFQHGATVTAGEIIRASGKLGQGYILCPRRRNAFLLAGQKKGRRTEMVTF